MAKEVAGIIKLQIRGGAANPSPPVGPALGAKGVNIMEFCKQFNGRTQEKAGKLLPVIITVYADKSFEQRFHAGGNPVNIGPNGRWRYKSYTDKQFPRRIELRF